MLGIIPGGMTKLLQPLDISVNRCFKAELRKTWEHWMSDGEHSFTNTGRMRRATHSEVAQWVSDAWATVSKSVIINGFIKAEIIHKTDENENLDENVDENNDGDADEPVLTEEIARIFNSDTEDEDFDGFTESDF
ncbi:hypothetical protein SNE40_014210 [Patella caerulea]|uniref:DDE-1 domain-containing protein n=1 Tax=Patella caerulea TaxID=87958 RepID=A0AAN8JF80_PATCE